MTDIPNPPEPLDSPNHSHPDDVPTPPPTAPTDEPGLANPSDVPHRVKPGDEPTRIAPTDESLTLREATAPAVVLPSISSERMRQAMREYAELKAAALSDEDYQAITVRGQQQRFIKRQGWRKLAIAFNVSTELLNTNVERDAEGRIQYAISVVRATAQNGRFADGSGSCGIWEQRFRQDDRRAEHDIVATAQTRATNRACSDLFGYGEVSAEEMDAPVPTAPSDTPTRARSTDKPVRLSPSDQPIQSNPQDKPIQSLPRQAQGYGPTPRVTRPVVVNKDMQQVLVSIKNHNLENQIQRYMTAIKTWQMEKKGIPKPDSTLIHYQVKESLEKMAQQDIGVAYADTDDDQKNFLLKKLMTLADNIGLQIN